MNRRQLLRTAAVLPAALLVSPRSLVAAEYDLVIRGGRVIDPGQRMDRRVDVAIRAGRIAALRPNIPASAADESIDAAGMLVTPGLIDIHVHARDPRLLPADYLRSGGVTTLVDGGSRGADNVTDLFDFVRGAPNRMRILINIGRLGNNPGGRGEFLDGIAPADPAACSAAIARNRDFIIGIKARVSRGVCGAQDKDVLSKAVEAATLARVPIMVHVGDTASPLPQLLAMLRPGDIVTHLYAPEGGILDARGNVLAEVRAARRRGIRFDFGNGRTEHWTWDAAQKGVQQGFPPDTISTDLEINGRTEQVFDLPTTMSKFLAMGMPLDQVIACVTTNAARSFKELNGLGTLKVGAPADVTVLELTRGNFEFVDNYKGTRTATQRLVTRAAVAAGKRFQ